MQEVERITRRPAVEASRSSPRSMVLRHPVVAVETFRKPVGNIPFGRKRRSRIGRTRVFGKNPVFGNPCDAQPAQLRQRFAPQRTGQRKRNEPLGTRHLHPLYVERRIAAAGGLRPQPVGHLRGIARRLEHALARSLRRQPLAIRIPKRRNAVGRNRHAGLRRNDAPHAAVLQLQAEPAVQIAIDRRTGRIRRRHPVGRDAAPFNRIHVRAVGTDADTVARSERGLPRSSVKPRTSHAATRPTNSPTDLGVSNDATPADRPIRKYSDSPRVKLFAGSGVKSSRVSPTDARRQSPREAIASSSRAAVVGHHVADIAFVFEPSFDLERGDARVDQRPQPIGQIEIAHREQVLAAQQPPSGGVFQIVAQTARLAAFAPIAAARRHRPRQITLTAVPHADRTVDETLDLGCRGAADRTDLVERQRPFQNHACETRIPQQTPPQQACGSPSASRRAVHRQRHAPQRHVLHDERVDTRRDEFAGLPFGGREFVVVKQRIERGVHPHAVEMCILRRTADVVDRIGGRMARTELLAPPM